MTKRVSSGRKRRRRRQVKYNTGQWTDVEKKMFLIGLKQFGKGKWKEIGTVLKTRSPVQIKSHGQKLTQREDRGEDIYADFYGLDLTLDSVSSEHQSSNETIRQESLSYPVSESEEDSSMVPDAPTNAELFEEQTFKNIEGDLMTPNPPITQFVERAHRAPVKKPLPRLALAKSIACNEQGFSTPAALPSQGDTIWGLAASRTEVNAAVALMSLFSLSHSKQSSTKDHPMSVSITSSRALGRPDKRNSP